MGLLVRVRFTKNFDFRPPERKGRFTIAYKAGWTGTVRRCCGDAAIAKGKAVEMPAPMRPERA